MAVCVEGEPGSGIGEDTGRWEGPLRATMRCLEDHSLAGLPRDGTGMLLHTGAISLLPREF